MNTDLAHPAELAALRAAFEADAPLGWDRVHAFEAEHGIVLPEPYRTFVAEISDGSYTGPPDYGLMPLAEQPDDGREADGERCLAEPFPLTEAWVWEEDDRPEEELEPLLDQVFGHGSIVLGTDGCGMDWHLVVTGPHRGHIWHITGEGALPFGAEFGFTTGEPGFAGWVAHWAANKPWFDAPDDESGAA
ncbi:SMI1/KNR4 family protein [Streptomyces sp. NPDC056352]|uniref:SMI1/KNR4 family protein n=1 Tax=Streptomyces sp. NPDC056352 TaxID=3345791 RepID=UPI0035DE0EAA